MTLFHNWTWHSANDYDPLCANMIWPFLDRLTLNNISVCNRVTPYMDMNSLITHWSCLSWYLACISKHFQCNMKPFRSPTSNPALLTLPLPPCPWLPEPSLRAAIIPGDLRHWGVPQGQTAWAWPRGQGGSQAGPLAGCDSATPDGMCLLGPATCKANIIIM